MAILKAVRPGFAAMMKARTLRQPGWALLGGPDRLEADWVEQGFVPGQRSALTRIWRCGSRWQLKMGDEVLLDACRYCVVFWTPTGT